MEHHSIANAKNKVWVSADTIIRSITESGLDYEFSSGITGKYTALIQAREEALKKEAEMKAAKQQAKTNEQNTQEEEMVC